MHALSRLQRKLLLVRYNSSSTPVIGKPGYQKKTDNRAPRKTLPTFVPLPNNHFLLEQETSELGFPLFNAELLRTPQVIGQPTELSQSSNGPLTVYGLPKKLEVEFRLLKKPYSVIREITKDAIQIISNAAHEPSWANRHVLTGERGCGKSFLMLQIVQHCIQDNWIVIYIPQAVSLINSTSPYMYDIKSRTYLQPALAFKLLQQILAASYEPLTQIPLVNDLVLDKQTIPKETPLNQVIDIAISESKRILAQSPSILNAVMKSISFQNKFPVLLAIDEFQALYGTTLYRDPHYGRIKSYHLSMPRLILEYASGFYEFKRGAVLGALSLSHTQHPLPLELYDTLQLSELDTRVVSPLKKRSKELLQYAKGLKKLAVPEKLTLEEAVGVFEVWKGLKVFGNRGSFYDETFLGKYTESGGNARDFVWKGLLASLTI